MKNNSDEKLLSKRIAEYCEWDGNTGDDIRIRMSMTQKIIERHGVLCNEVTKNELFNKYCK